MKAQRRHELQQNILGFELSKLLSFVKRHANTLSWAVLGVLIIVLVIVWVSIQTRGKHEKLRAQLEQAIGASEIASDERIRILQSLSRQDSDKPIAAQATVALGNVYLALAQIAEPGAGEEQLEKAAPAFRDAIGRFPDQKESLALAHIGLATVAVDRKEFDVAEQEYQTVIRMAELEGRPAWVAAIQGLQSLPELRTSVHMATTLPTQPATASAPASEPATQAAAGPAAATDVAPASQTRPAGPAEDKPPTGVAPASNPSTQPATAPAGPG